MCCVINTTSCMRLISLCKLCRVFLAAERAALMCMMMDEQFLGIALNRCIALLPEYVGLLEGSVPSAASGKMPKN